MALDMLVAIQELNVKLDSNFDIRIGINSGRVLAGVIGGFSRSTDNLRTDAPTNEWCVRSEIRSDDWELFCLTHPTAKTWKYLNNQPDRKLSKTAVADEPNQIML